MRPRNLAICALAAAATLVAAAPAAADSIAYIKDGNVWLASPDGAQQTQVTFSGGYSFVSQADDGTMIAAAPKERLHKISRTGRVLADFATYVTDGAPQSGPVNKFHGPFEPTISPDGKLVAYEWFNDSYSGGGSGCNDSTYPPCYVFQSESGVGITHSDRFTGPDEYGILTGWLYPDWVDNSTIVRSYVGHALNDDAVFNKIAPGVGDDQMDHWFYDPIGGQTVSDVELSRDRKALVGILGNSDELMRIYRPTHDPFNAPDWDHGPFVQDNTEVVEPCTEYSGPVGGKFEGVSIAPDSRHIAYSVANGIWVSDIPDLSGGCVQSSQNALKIPGGHHPDWGPANVPPQSSIERPGAGSVATRTPAAAFRVKVTKASLRKALKKGLVVTVGDRGGSARVTAKAGKKSVGAGRANSKRRKALKVRVKFTRKGKRALSAKRAVKLSLKVAYKPLGGKTAHRTIPVTLTR